MPVTQSLLDGPNQLGPDTLMVRGRVDNQLTQIRSKPHIMRADEPKNLRVVFPNESQASGGPDCVSQGLFRPPVLPKPWNRLHQGSNAGNVGESRVTKHVSSLHATHALLRTESSVAGTAARGR